MIVSRTVGVQDPEAHWEGRHWEPPLTGELPGELPAGRASCPPGFDPFGV